MFVIVISVSHSILASRLHRSEKALASCDRPKTLNPKWLRMWLRLDKDLQFKGLSLPLSFQHMRATSMILAIALLAVAQGVRTQDDAVPRDRFVDSCQNSTCVYWDDPARGYRQLKTGDLVFLFSTDIVSQVQMSFTGAGVMHVGMAVWSKPGRDGSLHYIPEFDGATSVLGMLEVSNHVMEDMETTEWKKGFHYVDMYHKLTHGWPASLRVYIKPRKQKLDDAEMDQLLTMSACFHSRRVAYLKMFTTSESVLGKFYRAWTKSTREVTEKFKNMFCSQFAALMVMIWDGELQMNRDGSVTSQDISGVRQLLPGDFHPGDVFKIENGKFNEPYQLQIPYPEYPKYERMALQQKALIHHPYARSKDDLQQQCKKLPSIEYVKEHLPTFMTKMEKWQRENTCDTVCGKPTMEMPLHPGGENVTWKIFSGSWNEKERRKEPDISHQHCMTSCIVLGAGTAKCSRGRPNYQKVAKMQKGGTTYKACCRTIRCAWDKAVDARDQQDGEDGIRAWLLSAETDDEEVPGLPS